MATCAELAAEMKRVRNQLAALEAQGQGHSTRAQNLLDRLGDLESQFDSQGCGPPPPPELGSIKTTVLSGPITLVQGATAALSIQIDSSNATANTTTADFGVGSRVPSPGDNEDVRPVGNWSYPIPPGEQTQYQTLHIEALPDAAVRSSAPLPIWENVFFGSGQDPQQQYDYLDPPVVITVTAAPRPSQTLNWTPLVASSINRDGAGGAWFAGRVNDVVPTYDDGPLVVATDSGGLWVVYDRAQPSGESFAEPVGGSLGSANMNCLVVGPLGTNQVFAGGEGTLATTDWTHPYPLTQWIELTRPPGVEHIYQLVADGATNLLIAATEIGIHFATIPSRPTGAWNWVKVAGLADQRFGGLALGPMSTVVAAYWGSDDPNNYPNSTTGIVLLKASAGSLTLVQPAAIHIADGSLGDMGLIRLASCAADPNHMYATVSKKAYPDPDFDLLTILRSQNGGADWTPCGTGLTVDPSLHSGPYNNDLLYSAGGQGQTWNNTIAASDVNPDVVAFGWRTSGAFISTDGADSWQLRSANQNSAHLHPDVHKVRFDPFDPTGNRLYCCSDGGVAVTEDLTTTFDSRYNQHLGNLQFNRVSVSPRASTIVAGTLQDNGVLWTDTARASADGSTIAVRRGLGFQRVHGLDRHLNPSEPNAGPDAANGFTSFIDDDGQQVAFLQTGQLLLTTNDYPAPQIVEWTPPTLAHRFAPVPVAVPKPGLPPNDQGLRDVLDSGHTPPFQYFHQTSFAAVTRPALRNASNQLMYAVGGLFGDVYGLYANNDGSVAHWEYLASVDIPAVQNIRTVASYDGSDILVGTSDGRIFAVDGHPGHQVLEIAMPGRDGKVLQVEEIKLADNANAWARQADYLLRLSSTGWSDVFSPAKHDALTALDVIPTRAGGTVVVSSDRTIWVSENGTSDWFEQAVGLPALPHCTGLAHGSLADPSTSLIYLSTYGRSLWVAQYGLS